MLLGSSNMLKFWVPYKIKGKEKDSFVRALTIAIRLGLNHEVNMHQGDEWWLSTDIVFCRELESKKVPKYLKLLKTFYGDLNAL